MEKMVKLTLSLLVLSGTAGLMSMSGSYQKAADRATQAARSAAQEIQEQVQAARDYVKNLNIDDLTMNLKQHKANIEKALEGARDCMTAKMDCIQKELAQLTPAERLVAKLWFWKHMSEMKQEWTQKKEAMQDKVAQFKAWIATADGKAFMDKLQPMIDAVQEKMAAVHAMVADEMMKDSDVNEDTIVGAIIAHVTPELMEAEQK